MSQGGPNKKVSNSLLALSSSAILAVYTAGYTRTRAAADRLTALTEQRRAMAVARVDMAARVESPAVASPVGSPSFELKREVAAAPAQPSPPTAEIPTVEGVPAQVAVETPIPATPPAGEVAPVIVEPKVEVPVPAPAPPPAAPTAPPKP